MSDEIDELDGKLRASLTAVDFPIGDPLMLKAIRAMLHFHRAALAAQQNSPSADGCVCHTAVPNGPQVNCMVHGIKSFQPEQVSLGEILRKPSSSSLGGLNEEEVAVIEQRAQKATIPTTWNGRRWETTEAEDGWGQQPKWHVGIFGVGSYPIAWVYSEDDANFIAHARTDIPKLIAALRAPRGEG